MDKKSTGNSVKLKDFEVDTIERSICNIFVVFLRCTLEKGLCCFQQQLDYANLSPTDVFLGHHDYDLFLLNQEIDTPSDNLNFQNTHV